MQRICDDLCFEHWTTMQPPPEILYNTWQRFCADDCQGELWFHGFWNPGHFTIPDLGAEQRILSCAGKACQLPCSCAARYPSFET